MPPTTAIRLYRAIYGFSHCQLYPRVGGSRRSGLAPVPRSAASPTPEPAEPLFPAFPAVLRVHRVAFAVDRARPVEVIVGAVVVGEVVVDRALDFHVLRLAQIHELGVFEDRVVEH